MDTRKIPENPLSPEFIKVFYDKNGNPLEVTPVEMNANDNSVKTVPTNGYSSKIIPQPIEEWLSLISKNIIALKGDVENSQNLYAQISEQVNQTQPVNLAPVENGIDATNHRIDSLNQKVDNFIFQINEQQNKNNNLAEQLNLMNEIVASIAKEFSNQQSANRQLSERIDGLNEQLNGNFVTLKQIIQNIDLNSSNLNSRNNDIDQRIAAMHRQIATSIERTEGNIVALNHLLNEVFEKVAAQENLNLEARIEMESAFKNLKQELMQTIENSKIDREFLITEIIERAKILRKLSRKPKTIVKIKARKVRHRKIHKTKKKIKPLRKVRKINKKILAKKLMRADISNYPSAVIVTERKMQRIGRTVFDVAKSLNKSVLMIMQDKMSESDGFEPVTYDAMANSDAVFIVTKKNMRNNFSLKTVKSQKPVFIVNQKIKFSKLN